MNFPRKLSKPVRAFAPFACGALLLTLPIACGGGGGGGGGGLGSGSASVTIVNLDAADADHTPDGACAGVAFTNTFTLAAVTVTDVSTGAFEQFFFTPPIAVGGAAPILGGLPPGTYSFDATYTGSIFLETDQCPPDNVTLVAGVNTINFEY